MSWPGFPARPVTEPGRQDPSRREAPVCGSLRPGAALARDRHAGNEILGLKVDVIYVHDPGTLQRHEAYR